MATGDDQDNGFEDTLATSATALLTAAVSESGISHAAYKWDPQNSKDWDKEKPTEQCLSRIKRCGHNFDFHNSLAASASGSASIINYLVAASHINLHPHQQLKLLNLGPT